MTAAAEAADIDDSFKRKHIRVSLKDGGDSHDAKNSQNVQYGVNATAIHCGLLCCS